MTKISRISAIPAFGSWVSVKVCFRVSFFSVRGRCPWWYVERLSWRPSWCQWRGSRNTVKLNRRWVVFHLTIVLKCGDLRSGAPCIHMSKKIETYVKSCLYNTTMRSWYIAVVALHSTRDHSEYGLSQWETTLPCNVVSRWLSPCPKDPWVRTTQNNTIPDIARLNITRYTCSITVTKVKEETNLKPIT